MDDSGIARSRADPTDRQVELRTDWCFLVLVLAALGVLTCLLTARAHPSAAGVAGGLAAALYVAAATAAVAAAHLGRDPVPANLAVAGCLVIAVGAAVDVGVTLCCDPSLAREANPLARAVLDSGVPLGVVLLGGAVVQVGCVVMYCSLFVGLLRHRGLIVRMVTESHPRSFLGVVKAALGCAHLTSWRQWVIPLRRDELPRMYPCCWWGSACAVATSLIRWYFASMWFGSGPSHEIGVALMLFCGGALAYIVLVWLEVASAPCSRWP
jgi:hypothetical protein